MRRYQGGRRNPRLPNYDYSTPGVYFITFCTAHRSRRLSRVIGSEVRLTDDGHHAMAA